MNTHRLVLKSGVIVAAGQAVSQICSFVRNVIVARLISPENYGIAATFAMTFYLVELMSNLGMENLMIQAEDGDQPRFQGTSHLLLVLRGSVNAVCIFVLADPISVLFGVPQASWAFRCLAMTPFIKGWTHLDTWRFQREMRFAPGVMAEAASSVVVTILALPLCMWRHDYSAMLWILVLQALASRMASNLAADRPYRWAWDSNVARRFLRFGWPLLINGFLMYIIFQGDRFVIGAAKQLFARGSYTLADLGTYSIAFALTMAPASAVTSVGNSILLPMLSRLQNSMPEFEKRYAYCVEGASLVASLVAIPFLATGGLLVVVIYGQKYAAAGSFIGWLAAMWALRVLRVAPTIAAMALGDTRNAMISNIVRTVALSGVLIAAAVGSSLAWIAISGFVGETLALGVCVGRLRREHGLAIKPLLKPLFVFACGLASAGIVGSALPRHSGWPFAFSITIALESVQLLAMLFAVPGMRRQLKQIISSLFSGLGGGERRSAA